MDLRPCSPINPLLSEMRSNTKILRLRSYGWALQSWPVILSWRVDINAFSTHLLYRNRLVRCYLGASVTNRQAQPFTGFSGEDDVPLSSLRIPLTDADPALAARPILLFNASLNVTRGKELALQTRKARSFRFYAALLGLHAASAGKLRMAGRVCGDGIGRHAKTGHGERHNAGNGSGDFGGSGQPEHGLLFGARALLPHDAFRCSPRLVARKSTKEKVDKRAVQTWDSGACFRNCSARRVTTATTSICPTAATLKIWRSMSCCAGAAKLIVACDASCDPSYTFADLHNAMERCRTDFGIEITRETHQLSPQDARVSGHFDVCKNPLHTRRGQRLWSPFLFQACAEKG